MSTKYFYTFHKIPHVLNDADRQSKVDIFNLWIRRSAWKSFWRLSFLAWSTDVGHISYINYLWIRRSKTFHSPEFRNAWTKLFRCRFPLGFEKFPHCNLQSKKIRSEWIMGYRRPVCWWMKSIYFCVNLFLQLQDQKNSAELHCNYFVSLMHFLFSFGDKDLIAPDQRELNS